MGLLSFDEFGSNKKPIKEKRSLKRKKKRNSNKKFEAKFKKLNTKTKKSEKLNETSFQVGEDYKVKVTVDVPTDLVKQYIDKVESETGKNPLDNFSEPELAEEMVNYIVSKNLKIDNLKPNFSVGDIDKEEIENDNKDESPKSNKEKKSKKDAKKLKKEESENKKEDGLLGMTDDDIESDNKDESEKEELDFEGEEADLDEDIEVEKEEEEEESLNDLYEKIGYKKKK